MNLAKLSANGQITVPAEVRRRLRLAAEDLDAKSEDDGTALVDGLRAGRTAVD